MIKVISLGEGLELEVSYKVVEEISVVESSGELRSFFKKRIEAVSSRHVLEALKDEPIIRRYRDSEHTKITSKTKRLVVVACGVPGVEKRSLDEAAKLASEYIGRFCRG